MRRTVLPFIFGLLLIGFYLFETQPSSTYRLGAFGLATIFTSPALTQDTTHLPAIKFIMAGPALKPETEDYLVKGIHFLYKFYITRFDYAFPEDLTVVIRVFSDNGAYKAYTSDVTTSPVSNHIGLYIQDTQEIVVWKGTNTTLFRKIVFHEASHLLLRSRNRFCPRWLSEGLSEYFEELDLVGKVPVIHPQLRKDKRIKQGLLVGKLPALSTFLAQTDEQWSHLDNQSFMPRTLAWSLVYFLMESQPRQQLLKDLLLHYREGVTTRSHLISVVNNLTGKGSLTSLRPQMAVTLENRWHRWVAQEREEQQITLLPIEQKG